MDPHCLFCKIGAKKIPAKLVYEDEEVFAFEDISPQSPTHILICPRKHFAALHDASGKIRGCSANFSSLPASSLRSGIFIPAIAPSSTTGAELVNPFSIFICIFSVVVRSVGLLASPLVPSFLQCSGANFSGYPCSRYTLLSF